MVEFAAFRGAFQDWEEQRRQRLLRDLVGIIKSHVYRKFGSTIVNSNFAGLSQENRDEFAFNAYVLAARGCVADVAIWKQRKQMSHVSTGFVFEDGDTGVGKLSKRMLEDWA